MQERSLHLHLAHAYWAKIVQKGDLVIDATCGGGKDTLALATLALQENAGEVIGIDIQEEALQRTRKYLKERLPPQLYARVFLFCQCHTDFPLLAFKPKLIVYNLGYLPKGNKSFTTQTSSTLTSLRKAFSLIAPKGAISVTCYPGHPEGAQELKYIKEFLSSLSLKQWNVLCHEVKDRPLAPVLFMIEKKLTA